MLAAVLFAVFVKINFDLPGMSINDDYHTGEFVLPYWAWKQFGLLPYVDLFPARGWTNVIVGFIAVPQDRQGGVFAVVQNGERITGLERAGRDQAVGARLTRIR